jgi:hypothetical protein
MRWPRTRLLLLAAVYAIHPDFGLAEGRTGSTVRLPLVFHPPDAVAQVGLLHESWTVRKHYETGCYYFGEGGPPSISISRELLAFYRERGFSRRSLCMALTSGIRFDPETGRRLTTYIVVYDLKALRTHPDDLGNVSPELPLAVPSCFARALPYSDCAWNYNPYTGKKLRAAETQKYRHFGQMLEEMIRTDRRAYTDDDNRCLLIEDDEELKKSAMDRMLCSHRRVWSLARPDNQDQYEYDMLNATRAYSYDVSGEFSKGFGYGLVYYDTGLGPSVSEEVTRAALDRAKKPAQIDPAKLRDLWDIGPR